MKLIENLKWRSAIKKFDAHKIVPENDLQFIKEAIQLSASSYGLQLYNVLIVKNKALRETLKAASWQHNQITDASHLFIFCNYIDVNDRHIDEHIELKATVQGSDLIGLRGYGDFIKGKLKEKSSLELAQWTAKQTYIALANLLSACAELKIDACPMEGFEPELYNKILGLEERGLNASVIAVIGYRTEEDQSSKSKKVRKPLEHIFQSY